MILRRTSSIRPSPAPSTSQTVPPSPDGMVSYQELLASGSTQRNDALAEQYGFRPSLASRGKHAGSGAARAQKLSGWFSELMAVLHPALGWEGVSSHSGRVSYITAHYIAFIQLGGQEPSDAQERQIRRMSGHTANSKAFKGYIHTIARKYVDVAAGAERGTKALTARVQTTTRVVPVPFPYWNDLITDETFVQLAQMKETASPRLRTPPQSSPSSRPTPA
jgi:hypothetical protein